MVNINIMNQKPTSTINKNNRTINEKSHTVGEQAATSGATAKKVRTDTMSISTDNQDVFLKHKQSSFNFFWNGFEKNPNGVKASKHIETTFSKYLKGNATVEDLEQCFKDSFEALKQFNIDQGRTTGTNSEDNKEILLHIFSTFRIAAVRDARTNSFQKGLALAKEHGSDGDRDWLYYDANMHYKSEAAITLAKNMTAEIASKYGLGEVDTKAYDSPSGLISYNKAWTWDAEQNFMNGKMKDPGMNPPKGFTMFYKESKYTQEELDNGTTYALNAVDEKAGEEELGIATWLVRVPRGYSLLKEGSKLDIAAITRRGERMYGNNALILDVNRYLSKYTKNSLEQRMTHLFYSEFNNFDEGMMTIGKGDFKKTFDVPYNLNLSIAHFTASDLVSFDESEISNGDEFTKFLSNFTLDRWLS